MSDIVSIAHRFGEDDRILAQETATCLRKWLEIAEAGDLISVVMVGEMANGDICTGHTAGARRYQVIGGLDVVKLELIRANIDN